MRVASRCAFYEQIRSLQNQSDLLLEIVEKLIVTREQIHGRSTILSQSRPFYRRFSEAVRSPNGLPRSALTFASRATIPGSSGMSNLCVINRRIDVVSYCV